MVKLILSFSLIVMLAACNSQPKKADGTPISVADVKTDIGTYRGREVRWAGKIVKVKNYKNTTEIEVLGSKLDLFGNANIRGAQQGRFIALFPGFKDPAHYAKDKVLTINGIVDSVKADSIGAHRYVYPLVRVKSHKLSEAVNYNYEYPRWHWGVGWGWHGRHHGSHIGVIF